MANSYLTRTTGSPTLGTKVTVSAWVKISEVPGGSGTDRWLFGEYGNSSNHSYLYLRNSSQIGWYEADGSGTVASIITNRLCRDLNGWYHFMIVYDTTDSTQADRFKLYINGERQTSWGTNTNNISQNYLPRINRTGRTYNIGGVSGYQTMFNGYMSHVAQVDGQALAPTVFGETDSTSGIWKFKSPSGVTWGNNGFHLKFENSAALGTDSSGESNTFTVNGNLRQALDTPSNVYCTGNPLSSGNSEAFSGNTNIFFDDTGQWRAMYSTLGASSGKWYMEAKIDAIGGEASIGIIDADRASLNHDTGDYLGKEVDSIGYLQNGEIKKQNVNQQTGLTNLSSGTIVGIAMDLDNNTVQFYVNGSASGNTVALTANKTYLFGFSGYSDTRYYANFGNGYFNTTAISSAGSNGNGSLFEYDVPSGYYALNTKNINTYG